MPQDDRPKDMFSLNLMQNIKWTERVKIKKEKPKPKINISPETIKMFGLTSKDFEVKKASKDHIKLNKVNLIKKSSKKKYSVTPIDNRENLLEK